MNKGRWGAATVLIAYRFGPSWPGAYSKHNPKIYDKTKMTVFKPLRLSKKSTFWLTFLVEWKEKSDGERENSRNEVEIVSIEELVPQNQLLRKVDKVPEDEYLYELVRPLYSSNRGRKSTDTMGLIGIILLQHMNGIRSLKYSQ